MLLVHTSCTKGPGQVITTRFFLLKPLHPPPPSQPAFSVLQEKIFSHVCLSVYLSVPVCLSTCLSIRLSVYSCLPPLLFSDTVYSYFCIFYAFWVRLKAGISSIHASICLFITIFSIVNSFLVSGRQSTLLWTTLYNPDNRLLHYHILVYMYFSCFLGVSQRRYFQHIFIYLPYYVCFYPRFNISDYRHLVSAPLTDLSKP